MARIFSRNAVFTAEAEVTEGTDPTIVPASNAMKVFNVQIDTQPQLTEVNEYSGAIDQATQDIVGGVLATVSFECYVKGSGTAGTAPEIGPVIKACGYSETLTGTAVPAVAEAAASGTTTSLTLGASPTGTIHLYRGMPISLTVNPAGGAVPFIDDYTASKVATLTDLMAAALDNTTEYSILKNVLYQPISTGIPSVAIQFYVGGTMWKILGARGKMQVGAEAGKPGMFKFQMTGIFSSHTDVAIPTTDAYQTTVAPLFMGATALIDRVAAAFKDFQIDSGNKLIYPPNPNSAQGFDPAQITERRGVMTIDPDKTLVATRDLFTKMTGGTPIRFHARWGGTAGNRVGIVIPSAQVIGSKPGSRDGVEVEQVQLKLLGENAGHFICLY